MQHNQETNTVKTVQTVEQPQKPIDHQSIQGYAVSSEIVILIAAFVPLVERTGHLTDSVTKLLEALNKLIEALDKLSRNRHGKKRKTR